MEFIPPKRTPPITFMALDFKLTSSGGIIIVVHLSQPIVVKRTCFLVMLALFRTSSLSGHATLFKIDPAAFTSVGNLNLTFTNPPETWSCVLCRIATAT
ncbi:unnamed protein product [Phytomonas sp. Hart1]|nr:unnamed protein product [Phytomonas sp. Hart1]|eukprot:CCW72148.1 unnamed protein product [Phytomonas sp. isolate Hart1]